ncbi:Fur family transcriptional regulator [Slackia exigua]|uniref:Fur family transcriptional regulator n=1 Tax=Slackia exigua TaxID=84109 RepID=UPI0021091916|nr:Fur family transcriptional regulator [Slackia exigua]MCQ5090753.1 transcriptional repressor [Slackia exigua]MDU5612245.1 Fur family transcriptional regulator [Slackia sp.]
MRYSRQREAIRACVMDRSDHPTAQDVYREVLETFPRISVGTVYRNLMQLADAGEIRLVDVGDGTSRFDCNADDHQHFKCVECNRIFDVASIEPQALEDALGDSVPGMPSSFALTIYGVCDECLKESQD